MFRQWLSTFSAPQVDRIRFPQSVAQPVQVSFLDRFAERVRLLYRLSLARCQLCGTSAASDKVMNSLCLQCIADMPEVRMPCTLCGGNAGSSLDTLDIVCGQCVRKPPQFDRAASAFEYEFPLDLLIQRLKYGAALHWLNSLAPTASQRLQTLLAQEAADPARTRLIPVPLHRSKYSKRGFNQSLEISRALGSELNLVTTTKLLKRLKATGAQAAMALEGRRDNVRDAFAVNLPVLSELRSAGVDTLVLIDDVLTTGATLDECASTLRKALATQDQPLRVLAFTLARRSQR